MNKPLRNDPCPCGSGLKYKKCCIDKILAFPKMSPSKPFMDLVQAEFASTKAGSLDEVNLKLNELTTQYNSRPEAAFLGLSPTQMSGVLYRPFSLKNNLFTLKCTDVEQIKQVPFFRHCFFLLARINFEGQVKATQKGNLPRALVREMFYEYLSEEKYAFLPNTEDDSLVISRARHVLEIAGLIKKRSNKFSLTKKGEELLPEKRATQLFELLVLTFLNQWNWAFGDRYSELPFIQQSVAFNFFLLNKKCQTWTDGKELGKCYLEAFPQLVHEADGYFGPEKEVINCFSVRFLSRVCVPLGLLELKEEKGDKPYESKDYFRVSAFFKDSLRDMY